MAKERYLAKAGNPVNPGSLPALTLFVIPDRRKWSVLQVPEATSIAFNAWLFAAAVRLRARLLALIWSA